MLIVMDVYGLESSILANENFFSFAREREFPVALPYSLHESDGTVGRL